MSAMHWVAALLSAVVHHAFCPGHPGSLSWGMLLLCCIVLRTLIPGQHLLQELLKKLPPPAVALEYYKASVSCHTAMHRLCAHSGRPQACQCSQSDAHRPQWLSAAL